VCDQFRVNFSGENSQLLELCTAYLTPYFQTASQGTFEAQAFCTSPDNVIIPPSISNGNGQLIQFHKGRTAVRYNVSPNMVLVRELSRPDCYLIDRERMRVVMISPHALRPNDGFEPAWLVRLLMTRLLETLGVVKSHCGAIAVGGIGFAVGGQKGSGKTSLILGLLQSGEVDFITNDTIYLKSLASGRLKILGWPSDCGIALGTLSHFPQLRHLIRNDLAAINDLTELWYCDEKVSVGARSLAELFDVELCGEADLKGIIFPKLGPYIRKTKIRRLSIGETYSNMLALSHTPYHPNWPDWAMLRKIGDEALATAYDKIARSVAARVDAFEILGGRDTVAVAQQVYDSIIRPKS